MHLIDLYASDILTEARRTNQRTGQCLFNNLPHEATSVVAGKLWDPFHRQMVRQELKDWIGDHLIFDGTPTAIAEAYDQLIGVFSYNEVLWEKSTD